MNAPVRSVLPADKQREREEALAWFRAQHAKHLSYMQNAGIGPFTEVMPDSLEWLPEYDPPFWRATTYAIGPAIEGDGAAAKGALADMMRLAEKHVTQEQEYAGEGV